MAEVHHFTYGAFNPVAATLVAFVGAYLGTLSAARARQARTRGRRTRWFVIAAFAIGGGIWLMHFAALLGFDLPGSPVRYGIGMTALGLALTVLSVGAGLMLHGHGRRGSGRLVMAGAITGLGLLAAHYAGMHAVHVAGVLHYRTVLVAVSGLGTVVAAVLALAWVTTARGWWRGIAAGAATAVVMCGAHYGNMAAIQVELAPPGPNGVDGLRPLLMIVPVILVTTVITIGVAFSALQAMTEEVFTDGAGVSRRGAHAGTSWSLRQTTIAMTLHQREPGPRPSPLPVPPRPASGHPERDSTAV
ncbi:MHYT domain-containing protein [Mangrovihabitans endophyticus]|uniref:MHYT domain-containing protein n=1 Tax=Mangrovihabitans endophyticus TaxID=1751298 RepID=A0A8J3C345_9ACTN|nr:MHYT domain-containing protein [Mangrovihabitans endophyticus]GGL02382.1 hypothetical protein GCM10012284_41140 [Mangrovihabitans endophyticus]